MKRTMSFSFNFGDEDVDDGLGAPAAHKDVAEFVDPLEVSASGLKEPELVPFDALMESIVGSRFTFEEFVTPKGNVLYRRELYDVKHQLMNEDDALGSAQGAQEEAQDEFKILVGDTGEDLKKKVYEGGLKSWECSIDLADYLDSAELGLRPTQEGDCCLELGCGTSLPSLLLFTKLIRSGSHSRFKFILTDYNKQVLRLVTLPNVVINWAVNALSKDELEALQRTDNELIPIVSNELQVTKELVARFKRFLAERSISFELVCGGWNKQFLSLIDSVSTGFNISLILTSETIYSQDTLRVVVEMLLKLAGKNQGCVSLVAAKDIYFGVGGSIVEFKECLNARIAALGLHYDISTVEFTTGLKRSIVVIR